MVGPNFFALLHVTTLICIEMERELISIIDNWNKESHYVNLKTNWKEIN
jgi:hypothetical protein